MFVEFLVIEMSIDLIFSHVLPRVIKLGQCIDVSMGRDILHGSISLLWAVPVVFSLCKMASSSASSPTRCPACLDSFNTPKLLPCLHTFCLKCIKKCRRDDQTSVIRCPVCRADHEIPHTVESKLLDDFSVPCKRVEIKKCQLCVGKNEAISSCKDCRCLICSKCVELHKVLVPFQHHSVTSISDDDKPLLKNPLCAHHNFEPCSFYCSTCQMLVCVYCVVHDHRNHTIADNLDKAFQEQLHTLSIPYGFFLERSQAVRGEIKAWENFEKFFGEHINDLKSTVERDASAHIQAVQEHKNKVIGEIEEVDTKIKKEIWAAKATEEFKLESMEAAINFSDRISKCDRDVYLHLTSQLSKRFSNLSQLSDMTVDRQAMIKTSSQVPLLYRFIDGGNFFETLDLTMSKITGQYGNLNFSVAISPTKPGMVATANYVLQSNTAASLTNLSIAIFYGKDLSHKLKEKNIFGNKGTLEFTPVCGGKHQFALLVAGIITRQSAIFEVPGNLHELPSNKVRRGPDWCYGNLTVPLNTTGVITHQQGYNQLQVRWSNGIADKYRWGLNGCYDVELIL